MFIVLIWLFITSLFVWFADSKRELFLNNVSEKPPSMPLYWVSLVMACLCWPIIPFIGLYQYIRRKRNEKEDKADTL